jgi:hypothetical protein
MRRPLLTVSGLVEAAGPPTEEVKPLWLRRARDLSSIGALPVTRRHEGTGRHRLYSVETVYLAAVLFRMADLGVPIGYLARIARLITKPRRAIEREQEFQAFWQEAKTMTNPQDAHMAIQPAPGLGTFYEKSFGPIAVLDGAWAVINLTRTFRQLKL